MDGYQNRRTNVTMRYGRRSFRGGRAMRAAAATRFACHGKLLTMISLYQFAASRL
jgi:hypothetical protein